MTTNPDRTRRPFGFRRWPALALVTVSALLGAACSGGQGTEADAPGAEQLRAESLDDAASDPAGGAGDGGGATVAGADGDGADEGDEGDGGDGARAPEDLPPQSASAADRLGPILYETGDELAGEDLERYLARRFEAFWQAFDHARERPTGDPVADYPELLDLAAGEQLEVAHAELAELFDAGHAIREPDRPAVEGLDPGTAHRVRVEEIDGGVAELVSCLVNDQVRYEVASGAVIGDTVRTVQARSTMARAEGTWKLIRSEATGLDQGVAGCWLEDEAQYPY